MRPTPIQCGSIECSTNSSYGFYQTQPQEVPHLWTIVICWLTSGSHLLASRRVQHDLLFIRNLFHSRLDSHILLRSFYLHAPTRSTRTQPLFYEPRPRVNKVKRGLFFRVPQLVLSFLCGVPEVDVCADALVTFKAHVVKYVSRL